MLPADAGHFGRIDLEVCAVMELPEDGALRLGLVRLPAGQRRALNRPADKRIQVLPPRADTPVAWLTDEPVSDPGRVWSELSEATAGTALVPFLAVAMRDRRGKWARPWDSGEFCDPEDVALIDGLDPAEILRWRWGYQLPVSQPPVSAEDDEEIQLAKAETAPFAMEFPGLAPAIDEPLDPARLAEALGTLHRPLRIGLAPAARPADVLPAIGWAPANWTDGSLPAAAVLRSWEGRFGARLLQVEKGAISLLVERPPRDEQAAQRIAAELWAFCDECHLRNRFALTTVSEIAGSLPNTPIWRFWWD
jgi:hypothetical protein